MSNKNKPSFNPLVAQQQIRENATEVQNFLSDLSNWSTEMKAKELGESLNDLTPTDNVPLRNDPSRTKTPDINGEMKDTRKLSSSDYSGWEKFDAEKACEEIEQTTKPTESQDEIVRRKAIELRLRKMANQKKDLGNQSLKEKNFEKAIEYYTEGIRCDKKSAVLYANRAQANIYLKKYRQAIDDCTQAIQNDFNYIKAYYRRAKACVEISKLNDAKNDLNQVLKIEPGNIEAKQLLNEINRKTMQSLFGPSTITNNSSNKSLEDKMEPQPRPSVFPGIQTVLGSRLSRFQQSILNQMEDDDDICARGDADCAEKETYPKEILPINKPMDRRSKRPLLPIHVKVIGEEDKKFRLDYNGNEGSYSSSSGSNTPAATTTSPPELSDLPSTNANDITPTSRISLPSAFSQLKMATIPPKPKTAAQFNLDWKKLKPYPDLCAQYLKQMDAEDYTIFQDSMECSTLSNILDLLLWEFLPQKWNFETHLQGLLKVGRFNTLVMFLTEKDRANVRKLISECPTQLQNDLREVYNA